MKTKYFLLAFAALGAVACSEVEEITPNVPNTDISAEKGYISFDLKSTDDVTRADNFRLGTEAERTITGATFYFFTESGAAFPINQETGDNFFYRSFNDGVSYNEAAQNIESVANPVIVVKKYKGEFPAKVAAVVNYEGTSSLTLSDLKNNLKTIGHTDRSNFIMTNSVYAADGKQMDATPLTIENFQTDEAMAMKHPVKIYVERVNARLTVDNGDALFNTGTKLGDTEVYAKIENWGIVGNQTESYYIKTIDPNWTEQALGLAWNDVAHYRSYWTAKVVDGAVNQKFVYSELNKDNSTVEYLGEQTDGSTMYVVKAQLVTKDGDATTPVEIAQWYGINYAGEEALLTMIASSLSDKLFQFNGVDTYTSIAADQIKCVDNLANTESYEVRFQLADGVDTTNWFIYDGANYVATDANEHLGEVAPAKVWKDGQTYYYAKVRHLGAEGSDTEFGIVRNHSYEISVKGVQGWGTPVYNPNKDVVPTRPSDRETFIAAEINVLSWRIVAEDVTLM